MGIARSSDSGAATRLASYGTLAPGRMNHNQMAGMSGEWRRGTVRGRLLPEGWGTVLGYPGLVLDPQGTDIEVFVFESPDLPEHWARLDQFEGPEYRRVVTEVSMPDGSCSAHIYVVAE